MIFYPTSLFLEKKNEDGYFYIFVATKFENGTVSGKTYIPDVDNERYILDEDIVRDIKGSTFNFEMVCCDKLRNNTIHIDTIFENPNKSEAIH